MADYFKKYKSLYSSTSNSFGTGTGETVTPASVSGLPTDTEITLTFDRVDSTGAETPNKLERIKGTISGGNFVIAERGVDGTTEQAHTSPVVEMIWNADDWNDLITGLLVEHTQTGLHKNITGSNISASNLTVTNAVNASTVTASKVTVTGQRVGQIYDNGNSGSAITVNWLNGETQKLTLTASTTLTFSNVVAGSYLNLWCLENATGGYNITFPSGTLKVGGAISYTTTSGTNFWIGMRAVSASDIHILAVSDAIS